VLGFLGDALVAQRIEQEPSNLLVAGSSPAEGTHEIAGLPLQIKGSPVFLFSTRCATMCNDMHLIPVFFGTFLA
jgi:hypothetical protein